jgi:hypothetical protein
LQLLVANTSKESKIPHHKCQLLILQFLSTRTGNGGHWCLHPQITPPNAHVFRHFKIIITILFLIYAQDYSKGLGQKEKKNCGSERVTEKHRLPKIIYNLSNNITNQLHGAESFLRS